ncbi:hypothetical protein E3P81_03918 [Wallemia ichthyophaga]|nr:hypothetical protein E3P97_03919 [Wallemia ichthyophaga]TIB00394.1 hypothetical protein E3P96_02666 [Wallemia ichthyophaga]TIB28052.1 hypothetical protein E3P85_03885 [Wallemia ichthyophaga]TIB43648.1 hypothetical protein E3P82_03924 [Wallemia ichthyophaga]TIB45804.1 hypothetical protein E3P81_03918 [Wallemia ichthyophaga]
MRLILTLVRHGESTDNLKSLWAGWRDSALSNHGMSQAKLLGESLADYPIKAIIASDLTRARWTAEQILQHNKSNPPPSFTLTDLLREQSFGKGEGKSWQQAQWQRKVGQVYFHKSAHAIRQSGRDFKFEDGESLHDVAARAEEVIENMIMPYVMASAISGEETHVFVVAHGILLAELQYALLKRRPQGIAAFQRSPLENTGWHRIQIGLGTPAQASVMADGGDGIETEQHKQEQKTPNNTIEQQESLVEGPPDELNLATPLTESIPPTKDHFKPKKLDVRYTHISEAGHLRDMTRAKMTASMAFDERQMKITDLM